MTAEANSPSQPLPWGIANNWVSANTFPVIPAIVGFFFSFRAITVLVAVRVLQADARAGVGVNLVCELLLLVIAAFGTLGPPERPLNRLWTQPSFRWVLLYLLFSGCSLAWSSAISPATSFLYWWATSGDLCIVASLLRADRSGENANGLMAGFICSTCMLATVAWIMPAQSDLRLGDIEYFNTNQIANLCAFAIFFAQVLDCRRAGRWRIAKWFLALTLLRSLSKATLVAFALSEGFLIFRDRSLPGRRKLGLATLAVMTLLIFAGLFQTYYGVYTTAGNQAETLTGRTAIWAFTLSAALEKPWFGNGFDAMWKVFPPFGNELFEARHAENELLQQFFAYGIAGVVMLCGIYGSLLGMIRRLDSAQMRLALGAILLYVVIRGLAEAEPFDLLLPLWVVTLMIGVSAESIPRPSARLDTSVEQPHSQPAPNATTESVL